MYKWLICLLIVIILYLVYRWITSDDRKRSRLRDTFKKGPSSAAAAVQTVEDVRTMHRPNMADFFRAGAVLRDRAHIEGTPAQNALVVQLFQAGLGALLPPPDEDMEVAYMIHQMIDVGVIDRPRMEEVHNADMATRLAHVQQDSSGRAETTARFLDVSQKYTSAAQNVHDSAVNSDLRETLAIIEQDTPNMGVRAAILEAQAALGKIEDPLKRAKGVATLREIAKGYTCGTFEGRDEASIFAAVWSRCDHLANAGNKHLMREAIIDALVDAVEKTPVAKGKPPNVRYICDPVCINGRIGRVVNSLTLLDFDPRVGSAMTFEAYRNQVLEEVKGLFNNTLEDFEHGTDEQKAAADAFEEGKDEEAALLLTTLDKKIEECLEHYTAKIPPIEMAALRKECKAYLVV